MENIDKNADVLTILDSLQDYASEYEARKKKQEEEEKKNKAEEEKALAQLAKKRKVEDEIAEILGKIKAQEAKDAERFEEERKIKEAKRKKEEEMKAKIAEEIAKIQQLEEEQQAKIAKEQQRRADEKLQKLLKEREEQKKKEEWEAARKEAEKKKKEEEMQAHKMKNEVAYELAKIRKLEETQQLKIMKEMQMKEDNNLDQLMKEKEEQQNKVEREAFDKKIKEAQKKKQMREEMQNLLRIEEAKKKVRDEELRQQKIEEEEKNRKLLIEEETKRLLNIEKENSLQRAEEAAKKRKEDDKRIVFEIMARKQAEEEEYKRMKQEAEESRLQAIEDANKKALENKKKAFENKVEEKPADVFDRPKRKSVNNPFAKKFEEIAANAANEEKLQQEMARKKKKDAKRAKDILRRSKQILNRASRECIKKSQNLSKKKSNDSLQGESFLQKSLTSLRRSLSKDHIKHSKSHLYDKDKNLSSKNLSHGKPSDDKTVSKQKMQNYFVSQVLFDGKEDVRTSRMHLQNKAPTIAEETESKAMALELEKENKRKELAMLQRENDMRKQVEEELSRIKQIEEEQRIKFEEAQFESYKKEMEKYLSFVCEDKEPKEKKTKKKVVEKALEEPAKKLKLNIGNLKSQFEEPENCAYKEPTSARSAPANVKKLNPMKIFNDNKEDEAKTKKKKEYVPVIIDKAAFERTVDMFEKEKREKEQNEQRIKKRRESMEAEKRRLIEEKERHLVAENERIRKEEEEEEERQKAIIEVQQKEMEARAAKSKQDTEAVLEPEPAKPDIFEQIRNTLAQVKDEEEKQRIKIEKERKKKELMKQIQSEITKINTVDTSLQQTDEENTPAWVKMIMGKENKAVPVTTKAEQMEPKTINRAVVAEPVKDNKEDVFAPKWITLFQERNKKLQAQQEKREKEEKEIKRRQAELKQSISVATPREGIPSGDSVLKKSKTTGSIDLRDCELPKKKTIGDVKTFFEEQPLEEQAEVEKKTGKQKVADKVKRVKSLLMESGKTDNKSSEKKVTKQKANQIKTMFESKGQSVQEKEKPKRPKRKLVEPKIIETDQFNGQSKKEEQVWKWKEKSVSELYEFINHNREHLPTSLSSKADKTFCEGDSEMNRLESTSEVEVYSEYITDIQSYINEDDKDETESVFKDTIVAYLDLIDANPRKNVTHKPKEKKMFSVNTAAVKGLLETDKAYETEKKEKLIGKVDTSFLYKETEVSKCSDNASQINIKSIRSKYEDLGVIEEPKELYSMKRKLKVVPQAPETKMPSKQEQVQYQWKYKQKGIEELQRFLADNKDKAAQKCYETKVVSSYVPTFILTDLKNRIEDEDKKMEEFEKFMEDMHEYLENDTKDEEESAFKWGIHSYLDLIEDGNDAKPNQKYEKKEKSLLPENIPKMTDRKAQLHAQNSKQAEGKKEKVIGKVDHSFLQRDDNDNMNKSVKVSNTMTSKMRSQFEEDSEEREEQEKVVVKRKLIDLGIQETSVQLKKEESTHDWKYKKKSLLELQEFINKNKDIAPTTIVTKNNKLGNDTTTELLAKSNKLRESIVDKEDEFNDFMDELDNFLGKNSFSKEEIDVKEGIQGYLDLIDTQSQQDSRQLPVIGSVKRVKDIQSSLSTEKKAEEKEKTKLIGKVSHFFKKSTNEKVDSSAIRENIATLLQPGKAKILGKSFESKPKLARANSALDLTSAPKKVSLKQFTQPQSDTLIPAKRKTAQEWSFKQPKPQPKEKQDSRILARQKESAEDEKYKYEWDGIEDPLQKQNAILAKYGLKPRKQKTEQEEEDDLEDILNYECTDEVNR